MLTRRCDNAYVIKIDVGPVVSRTEPLGVGMAFPAENVA